MKERKQRFQQAVIHAPGEQNWDQDKPQNK